MMALSGQSMIRLSGSLINWLCIDSCIDYQFERPLHVYHQNFTHPTEKTLFHVLKLFPLSTFISHDSLLLYNKIKSPLNQNQPLSSHSHPMIFKLSYNNQTHLYNKSISIQNLTNYTSKIFRDLPHNFTFVYMSPKGQMTYIESDADLIGLKYCCSHTNDMIVKLHIVKNERFQHFGIDEDIQTKNIVKENMETIAENVFARLEDQSETEAISEYLEETYSKVSEEIARAETQMINKEVHQYLFNLYDTASRIAAEASVPVMSQKPQRRRKAVRFSVQKPIIHRIEKQQKSMDEMVSEKVLSMIPSLVDKIYARMQAKMNDRCKKCMKKEMDIEYAIDEEINRKLASICIYDENPEE